MALHPPGPRRERILAYGQSGAGKSNGWVAIAEWIARTKADAKVYAIDTDLAWDAMRPVDGHLDSVVIATPIYEWDDYKPAIHRVQQSSRPQDWFVIDLVDKVWDESQEGYVNKVFGVDIDEFYLKAKMANDAAMIGGDYGTNWTHVKKMYQSVVGMIPRFQGHVYCAATATSVKKPDEGAKRTAFHDDVEVVEKYGKFGWKPSGEKKLAHLFHTEVLFSETPSGYKLSVVKDRQRERITGVNVSPDFVTAYLMKVAGWKP